MEIPFIEIGSWRIEEPMTMFTDFLISLLCVGICFKMRKYLLRSKAVYIWFFFFAFLGLSTLVGGVSHGFHFYTAGLFHQALWLTMQILSGAGILFAQRATVNQIASGNKHKELFLWLVTAQFFLFLAAVFYWQNFLVVTINTALGLVPVMIFQFRFSRKIKSRSSAIIGWGIVVSFLPAVIHTAQFSLHKHFNHKDISHVLLMISLGIMAYGVVHDLRQSDRVLKPL